jgi:hypothetical protein
MTHPSKKVIEWLCIHTSTKLETFGKRSVNPESPTRSLDMGPVEGEALVLRDQSISTDGRPHLIQAFN